MKKHNLIVVLILCLLTFSCHKEPITSVNEFNENAFPVNVGNWWRYRHTDMLSNIVDTVTLKVVSVNNVGTNKEYTCHIVEFGQNVDTGILSIGNNLISYESTNTDYSYFGDFILKLPFHQNSDWQNNNNLDSTKVISYTNDVKILGKSYNIFFLKRIATSPGYSIIQTISVSKNIGIVEHNLNIFNGFPIQKQNLQLIDYELK